MKWLKRILITIGILALLYFGGIFLYDTAYSKGEIAGYDKGYPVGEEIGYSSGKQDGYNSGKTEGYSLGKQDGYEEGFTSGEGEGYEEGVKASLGHGYTLTDPTYREVIAFLRKDKTDKHKYIEDSYVCSHFARDVCNNAETEELRCAFVELRYSDRGHSIVAFDTIDKGLVYFDAITDESVKPVVGKRYYQCIEPKPGYYYEEPLFDDTILDILVIW